MFASFFCSALFPGTISCIIQFKHFNYQSLYLINSSLVFKFEFAKKIRLVKTP
jgi:hypothetical protein